MQIPISAVNSLCAILHDLLLPEGNIFPQSWYLFRKEFTTKVKANWKRVDICENEHHIFEFGETVCPICHKDRYNILRLAKGDTSVPKKFFYEMNFINQIKDRFKRDKVWVQVCTYM